MSGVVLFIDQADQVCNDLSIFLVIDTANSLVARVGDLLSILGQLDLRNECSGCLILNRSQLVHAAEGWAVFGCDQVGADTPGVDGCALQLSGKKSESHPGRWKRR